MRHPFRPLTLLVLALAACEPSHESQDRAPRPDAGTDGGPPAGPTITLRLEIAPLPPGARPRGTLRVHIESREGALVDAIVLPDVKPEGTHVEAVAAPGPGRWRLRAFFDRDGDGAFGACPFPPAPDDTERADAFDNVFGLWEGAIEDGAEVDLRLERHLCGPGEPDTGLIGEVAPPEEISLAGVPVFLQLEPILARERMSFRDDEADAADEPEARAILRLPLFPGGLTAMSRFEIGELLPGRFRAIFYADADGDGLPTPCGDGIGGGDRFLAVIEDVDVAYRKRSPLPAPVMLDAAPGCLDPLTGVEGRLDLAPALSVDPPEPLAGRVRLALFDPAGNGSPVASADLLPSIAARPRPAPFTVTGLPPGTWRLAVYVDRDDDGQFGPCGGLQGGIDTVFALLEGVVVRDGRVSDLGTIELTRGGDCAPETVGVRGRLRMEPAALEEGPMGSGRPVRLELYPGDEHGERRSVPLFDNHTQLPQVADADGFVRFTAAPGLPPGHYRARLYLDTDRDGTYASCRDAAFSDRASSALFPLEIRAGELIELGDHELASEGCPVPIVLVEPTIELAAEVAGAEGDLWLRMVEAGGWSREVRVRGRTTALDLPFATPPIGELAPGLWRLTAWLDTVPDQAFGACGDELADLLGGTVEIALDAATPTATPVIPLQRVCR